MSEFVLCFHLGHFGHGEIRRPGDSGNWRMEAGQLFRAHRSKFPTSTTSRCCPAHYSRLSLLCNSFFLSLTLMLRLHIPTINLVRVTTAPPAFRSRVSILCRLTRPSTPSRRTFAASLPQARPMEKIFSPNACPRMCSVELAS